MNLVLTDQQAAALLRVLSVTIRDKTHDARINGWEPDPQLPALKEVAKQLAGKAES